MVDAPAEGAAAGVDSLALREAEGAAAFRALREDAPVPSVDDERGDSVEDEPVKVLPMPVNGWVPRNAPAATSPIKTTSATPSVERLARPRRPGNRNLLTPFPSLLYAASRADGPPPRPRSRAYRGV